MKTNSRPAMDMRWLSYPIAALILSGCAGHFRPKTATDQWDPAAVLSTSRTNETSGLLNLSLAHALTEVASDGRFLIVSNAGPVKVDALSVLQLEFPKFAKTDVAGDANPEWKPMLDLMQFFQETATRMDEINSRKINSGNVEEVNRLHRDAAAVARLGADVFRRLTSTGTFETSEVIDIINGDHSTLTGFVPSDNGYVNLGRWLSIQLQERRDELQALSTNQQVKVRVQAVRESNGSRSALHVEGWDTFAEGAYQPIDKTGLRPTQSEQERLNAERQRAEDAKKFYESIMAKDSSLKQALRAKLKEVELKLDQLAGQLRSFPVDWPANQFQALTNRLSALAAADPQGPPARLLADLRSAQSDIAQAKSLILSVQGLVASVKDLNRLSPEELMFAGTGLFAQATATFQNLTNFASKVPSLPERLRRIREDLPLVAETLLEEQTRNTLQSVTNFLASLSQEFPEEARYAASLWAAAFGSFQVAQGTDAIKKPEGDWIPRSLDNLVPGRLDLKRSSIALGDLVTLRVSATNEATGEEIQPVIYETKVELMGLHGKPAVHLIFVRALSGSSEATQWKPNVAAAVAWHYTIRAPEGAWDKTWNWLYPGVGIHLASLDQGNDSVELGAGGIVSLWDGLLTGGYGYNFSDNPEHQYVFVGVNLLNLLQQGKKEFGLGR
jgi:hypothetical protein